MIRALYKILWGSACVAIACGPLGYCQTDVKKQDPQVKNSYGATAESQQDPAEISEPAAAAAETDPAIDATTVAIKDAKNQPQTPAELTKALASGTETERQARLESFRRLADALRQIAQNRPKESPLPTDSRSSNAASDSKQ